MICPRCHTEHPSEDPCAIVDLVRAQVPVPLAATRLVVVDVETTGFVAGKDRIVEVSFAEIKDDSIVRTLTAVVDPECQIPAAAAAIHGIDMWEVQGKPTFAQILDDLGPFLTRDVVLVGHNILFDLGFLNAEIARCGCHVCQWNGLALCTLRLARSLYAFKNNKLGSLAEKLGIAVDRTHRAGSDVSTTIDVFRRMWQHSRAQTVQDLLRVQGGNVVAPVVIIGYR